MAERASDTVKNTVKHLEKSASATERLADQTTTLAADRTVLAGERTYAAWVRTGLASLASGVGARALPGGALPAWMLSTLGCLLIAFSAFCFVAAVWRGLSNGPMPAAPSVKRMPRGLLLGVSGALLLAAIAALVGIWTV
jgi:putative membrane protein